jgi:Protein of unknown function (DUF1554)
MQKKNWVNRAPVVMFRVVTISLLAAAIVACSESSDNSATDAAIALAAIQATGSGASGSTATCATTGHCLIFVTNSNATLNAGISGLDANCTNDVNKPAGGGTYKAMVADGTNRRACTTANCGGGTGEHISWALKPNKEYRRADGTTVIGTTTANGVFAFPLTNAIQTTVVGTNSTVTGLNTNWTSSGSDCTDFAGAGNTSNGLHDDTSANLLSIGTSGCGNTMKVYCVEQ